MNVIMITICSIVAMDIAAIALKGENMQTQTTAASAPILVHCEISMIDPFEATLTLRSACGRGISVSAISLKMGESFDLNGGGGQCTVVDGEVLAIVARAEGHVIACGIYEVSGSYYAAMKMLLIERVASNLKLMQSDKTPAERHELDEMPRSSNPLSPYLMAQSGMIASPEKIMLADLLTWKVEAMQ